MSEHTKKIIPKLKKNLAGFLADESGKITKEDVLKMGMMAMGVAGMVGVQDVSAGHSSSYPHANSSSHGNGGYQGGSYTPISNGNIQGGAWYDASKVSCNVNVVVNGHFNNANYPGVIQAGGITGANVTSHSNASSHSSHGSHGSHAQW